MKKEFYIFSTISFVCLILHILIRLKIYYPGNFLAMPLTAGMIFSWLFASSVIKDKKSANVNISFKELFQKIPLILRISTLLAMAYGIINFISNLSVRETVGWVDFNLGHEQISGLSGFWIAFYMIGLCAAWLKNLSQINFQKAN